MLQHRYDDILRAKLPRQHSQPRAVLRARIVSNCEMWTVLFPDALFDTYPGSQSDGGDIVSRVEFESSS